MSSRMSSPRESMVVGLDSLGDFAGSGRVGSPPLSMAAAHRCVYKQMDPVPFVGEGEWA
jgi:hypothetical protein